MPITVMHKEYTDRAEEWARIRDVLAGRDAVLRAGKDYVPMLGGQTPDQHQSYLMRGLWGGFTARTHDGVIGLVFSQDPSVEVPDAILPLLEDITLSDMSFTELAKAVFAETFAYGWGGILVDVTPATDQVMPADDRPYCAHYDARSVRWWQREKTGGMWKTTTVILQEHVEIFATPDPNDQAGEYGTETIEQYRVLKLRPETIIRQDGKPETAHIYRQEIWRLQTDAFGKTDWRLIETITPLRRKETLSEIPWTFTPAEGIEPHIKKSHLLDVADVNLDHWRQTVDIRHGGHFAALPTACAKGVPDDNMTLTIGAEAAWAFASPDFHAWYLEFSGAGLGFIRNEIEADERLMAILGARMLEVSKRAPETAETMTIRQAGEHSAVMTVALSVSKALEKALWWMAWWRGMDNPVVSVNLISALTNLALTTEDLTFMLKSVQAGKLTTQAFVEAVVRSGRVVGRTAAEEITLLETETTEREAETARKETEEAERLMREQELPLPIGRQGRRGERNPENANGPLVSQ